MAVLPLTPYQHHPPSQTLPPKHFWRAGCLVVMVTGELVLASVMQAARENAAAPRSSPNPTPPGQQSPPPAEGRGAEGEDDSEEGRSDSSEDEELEEEQEEGNNEEVRLPNLRGLILGKAPTFASSD